MLSFFDFLVVSGTFALGITLSMMVVGKYIYFPYMKELEAERCEESEDDSVGPQLSKREEFLLKYKDAWDEAFNETPEHEELEGGEYYRDQTPRGELIMMYDADKKEYIYYSKTRDIPYTYLENTCKGFVLNYKCFDNYQVMTDLAKKAAELKAKRKQAEAEAQAQQQSEQTEQTEEKTENESKEEDKVESVFATLKTTKNVEKAKLIMKAMNKFRYGGSLEDFANNLGKTELQTKGENGEEENPNQLLSFKEFKEQEEEKKRVTIL